MCLLTFVQENGLLELKSHVGDLQQAVVHKLYSVNLELLSSHRVTVEIKDNVSNPTHISRPEK